MAKPAPITFGGIGLAVAAMVVALALRAPSAVLGIVCLVAGGIALRVNWGKFRRQNELLFRNVFQEAAVGMVILDTAGRIRSVNKGFTDITLYSVEELIGQPLIALASAEDYAQILRDRKSLIGGEVRSYRAERRFIRKDGLPVWVRTSVSQLLSEGERHTIALVEDITEQKGARESLSRQAMHDVLTGLPNRRHFEEVIEAAIGSGCIEVALIYFDLDGFKLINDTWGHRLGDRLLKAVAGRVSECLPDSAFLSRIGGDEFAIVLCGLDGPDVPPVVPERVAELLLQAFQSPFQVDGHEICVGVSAGISLYPLDGHDSSALLQSADSAMYCAKRGGSNRYHAFTAEMRQDAHQRLTMESSLRRAVANREISLRFQPQYSLDSNKLVRFEALCRWFNPELGQVPPDRFIPIAEETGLIVDLGKYVLREACRQALNWQFGPAPVQIAVNVSAVQFARADFVDTVVTVLRETGLKPSLLELELTESCLIRDRDDSIRRMVLLKSLGIGISIDDFGTGYSSLSYIQSMPVDALKVDRSFTAKLGTSQTALSMVRAIVALTRSLGLRIVIEGVENTGQVEILRQLGCDEVQGYLYGRPEDAEASVDRVLRETTGGAPMELLEMIAAQ